MFSAACVFVFDAEYAGLSEHPEFPSYAKYTKELLHAVERYNFAVSSMNLCFDFAEWRDLPPTTAHIKQRTPLKQNFPAPTVYCSSDHVVRRGWLCATYYP